MLSFLSRLDIGNSLQHDVSKLQLHPIDRLQNAAAKGNSHASNENRAVHSKSCSLYPSKYIPCSPPNYAVLPKLYSYNICLSMIFFNDVTNVMLFITLLLLHFNKTHILC